jgi:mannose-1-phosphate guanylyltransferase
LPQEDFSAPREKTCGERVSRQTLAYLLLDQHLDMPSDTDASRLRPHAIVLAGGRGTRLEHITTALGEPREKQFCRLGSDATLLQQTVRRLLPLAGANRTTVVVRGDHHDLAASQLARYPAATLLPQPGDRGTGVAVLTAILTSLRAASDGVTILSPADHAFNDEIALREVLARAMAAAVRYRAPVLIGAEADSPRGDFGWIMPAPCAGDAPSRVSRFVEKPPVEEARRLMDGGGLFNTMLLVAPTAQLFTLFAETCPDVVSEMLPAAFMEGDRRRDFLRWAFNNIPAVDFSRDVLSRAQNLRLMTLPARAGWTDLGDEARLLEWLEDRGERTMAHRIRALRAEAAAPLRPRRAVAARAALKRARGSSLSRAAADRLPN